MHGQEKVERITLHVVLYHMEFFLVFFPLLGAHVVHIYYSFILFFFRCVCERESENVFAIVYFLLLLSCEKSAKLNNTSYLLINIYIYLFMPCTFHQQARIPAEVGAHRGQQSAGVVPGACLPCSLASRLLPHHARLHGLRQGS